MIGNDLGAQMVRLCAYFPSIKTKQTEKKSSVSVSVCAFFTGQPICGIYYDFIIIGVSVLLLL